MTPQRESSVGSFLFKAISYIPNATQTDAGVIPKIQLAPDCLHMVADQFFCHAIVQLPPDFLIDLTVR